MSFTMVRMWRKRCAKWHVREGRRRGVPLRIGRPQSQYSRGQSSAFRNFASNDECASSIKWSGRKRCLARSDHRKRLFGLRWNACDGATGCGGRNSCKGCKGRVPARLRHSCEGVQKSETALVSAVSRCGRRCPGRGPRPRRCVHRAGPRPSWR